MSKIVMQGVVLSNTPLAKGIYKIIIKAEAIAKDASCGQFVNFYPKQKHILLPRPISICEIGTDCITLVYSVVGEGTRELATYKEGDLIRLSSPIGNGFKPQVAKQSILVGGGIGTAPLVELAKHIEGEKIAVFGFRQEPFLIKELENLGVKVYVSTDAGDYGFKGTVIELLEAEGIRGDYYYGCGPKPMLRGLAHYCEAIKKPLQVSLEERMGCGYGACVGCVCKTKGPDEGVATHKKVCKDGPVFLASEVAWDE